METYKLNDKLIAVYVPSDARDFKINNAGCIRYEHNNGIENSAILPEQLGFYADNNSCKIVGTVENNNLDFDCSSYVALCPNYGYRNYLNEDYNGGSNPFDVWAAYHLKTKEVSFLSLLESVGISNKNLINRKILIVEKFGN